MAAGVDFSDYFWGEKNDGFNVLYQNMKGGITAARELGDFLRERAKVEEDNSKAQIKLANKLTPATVTNTCGTFTPLLLAFKVTSDKLSGIHNQWSLKLNDLLREVLKYNDEQQKKHKQVKEDESPTLDAVKSIQDTTVLLHKTKGIYKQRCAELEKLKRDNASSKDLEKAESKFRKAQDDYKSLVDKYCLVRDDFERKMTLAAKHFQEVESAHLKQMREFIESYCQIVDNNNNLLGRVYQEFQIQLTDLTVDNLLEQFTLAKHTGLEKPGPAEFDPEKISLTSATGPASDISAGSSNSFEQIKNNLTGATSTGASVVSLSGAGVASGVVGATSLTSSGASPAVPSSAASGSSASNTSASNNSTGFLRRNRRKDKKKKSTGKDEDGGESVKDIGSDGEDVRKSETPTPEVDDEGYSKQPPASSASANDPWSDFNQTKTFDSSSDDSDDDTSKRKIKVSIKPVSNTDVISASVDELRSAVGVLELPPPPPSVPKESRGTTDFDGQGPSGGSSSIRRSHSQSQLNKPSNDLLGLTLHPMDPIDPPTTNITPAETQETSKGIITDLTSTLLKGDLHDNSNSEAANTSREVQDILGEFSVGSGAPALPPKQNAIPSSSSNNANNLTTSSSALNRPSSVQREKISNSLKALPRPPSRVSQTSVTALSRPRGTPSPALGSSPKETNSGTLGRRFSSQVSRTDSQSSDSPSRKGSTAETNFDLMKTPSFGFSRGPSPLTLGMSDVVPIAVAFQEVCHAMFNGSEESKCQTRLIGDMMVSFPAGIVQVVANNPNPAQLSFKIRNASVFESIVPNLKLVTPSELLSTPDGKVFEFKMDALRELLKVQSEMNPNAAYFNIDLLKYQVKSKPGAGSCPLQMVAYWKCSDSYTDLRLDYKYNAHAMATASALLNLSIAVPVDGGVMNMQSQPTGTWMKESSRALWKFTELSQHSDGSGVGSLRGRFQLSNGPGSPGTIAAQFNCEGTTLSGVDFELMTTGYRLSLTKKRFVSGKYTCVGDVASLNTDKSISRYAVPPEPRSTSSMTTATPLSTSCDQGPTEC